MNTPYVYVKGEDNEELTEIVAGSIVDAGGTWVARIWADFDGHDEVAAEIVQAVNSHEALVERLQESETLLIGLQALCIHQRYIERIQEQINDNRAALKLAGVK